MGVEVSHLIELRGVYDGWSVAVYEDGTRANRWVDESGIPYPGQEARAATVNAFLAGEPANGRWF